MSRFGRGEQEEDALAFPDVLAADDGVLPADAGLAGHGWLHPGGTRRCNRAYGRLARRPRCRARSRARCIIARPGPLLPALDDTADPDLDPHVVRVRAGQGP